MRHIVAEFSCRISLLHQNIVRSYLACALAAISPDPDQRGSLSRLLSSGRLCDRGCEHMKTAVREFRPRSGKKRRGWVQRKVLSPGAGLNRGSRPCVRLARLGLWPQRLGRLRRAVGTAPVVAGLLVSMIRDLLAGRMGVDAVAFVSMSGAFALGQYLAGIVIAVMYAGGNILEDFAVARAERDLRSLIDRAPKIADRRTDLGHRGLAGR